MTHHTPAWVCVLIDKALTPNERILGALLARYQGNNESAWPSRATLANDLGASERTVERLISSLVAKGKLTVQRPKRQGRGNHNTYIVHTKEKGRQGCPPSGRGKGDTGDALYDTKGRHGAPKKGDKSCARIIRKNKSKKESIGARTPRKPLCETDTGFERFWTAYPKKVEKKDAQKVWMKLRPSPELVETIVAAVESQKQTEQWITKGGQYIPGPAKWLKGERWEDQVGPANVAEVLGCGPCDEDEAKRLLQQTGLWKGEA